MQRFHINRILPRKIRRKELSSGFGIKGLYRYVTDTGELPNDVFYLRKLDPKAPDFNLSVVSSDKVDASVKSEGSLFTGSKFYCDALHHGRKI